MPEEGGRSANRPNAFALSTRVAPSMTRGRHGAIRLRRLSATRRSVLQWVHATLLTLLIIMDGNGLLSASRSQPKGVSRVGLVSAASVQMTRAAGVARIREHEHAQRILTGRDAVVPSAPASASLLEENGKTTAQRNPNGGQATGQAKNDPETYFLPEARRGEDGQR